MNLLACALLLLGACERSSGAPTTPFDGETARGYVKTQLDFGARVPGTEAARRTGDWIVAQMRARADTVIEQRWNHVTAKGDTLPLRNIFARFRPQASTRILYVTHWDSRPVSDQAEDPAKRSLPVPGANDGASGVGLFIALGDVLKKTPPTVGVDLLFVDGEDYGTFGPPDVDVLLGSTYFAAHMPEGYQPIFGVLFDMIGDADLSIPQESNSVKRAPEVVSRVWDTAAKLGYQRYFPPSLGYEVTDDHIPLLDKGLRVIDVIDLDYLGPPGSGKPNYHHTPEDTLDKVSAQSLKIVGDVAYALITGAQD
ncbi:MAG TPA: M28 family peptidase [Gemmatimonadaceae bacterium]|nr:M28 family peptidase [Gemmatimonadaceae bacterium]